MRQPVLKKTLCLWAALLMLLTAACALKTRYDEPAVTGGAAPPDVVVPSLPPVTDTAAVSDLSEFSLLSRDTSAELRFTLGVQTGVFPWGKKVGYAPQSAQPGLVTYNVDGFELCLYYTTDEQTGTQTLRSLQTTSPVFETPRGIKRGDTLESLLTAYDEGLVFQPDPGSVRGDFGVCRYVYDELYIFIRAGKKTGRTSSFTSPGIWRPNGSPALK